MLMSSVVSAIVTVSVPLAFNLVPIPQTSPVRPLPPLPAETQPVEPPSSSPTNAVRVGQIIASNPASNVNVRYAPTAVARPVGQLRVGDRVTILNQDTSRGSEAWYEIESKIQGRSLQGWVHGDFVTVRAGQLDDGAASAPPTAARPDVLTDRGPGGDTNINPEDLPIVRVPARRSSPTQEQENRERMNRGQGGRALESRTNRTVAVRRPEQFNQRYSEADLDYFLEIATGSEFTRADLPIRRWETDLKIKVHGTPTAADRQTVNAVVDELKQLVAGIDIQVLDDPAASGNFDVYFIDPDEFSSYVPYNNPGRGGFAWVRAPRGSISQATVLVASSGLTQAQRNHIIREEITQSLGLLNDSFQYRDSIFFQLWNAVTQYSERDERVIQMLYLPQIQPGMSRDEAATALDPLVSQGSSDLGMRL